jgi:hypothetical protein
VPSWLNEKAPSVHVASTIYWANAAATLQFIVTSVFSALAISPDILSAGNPPPNLLSVIDSPITPGVWVASRIMVYIFPVRGGARMGAAEK